MYSCVHMDRGITDSLTVSSEEGGISCSDALDGGAKS